MNKLLSAVLYLGFMTIGVVGSIISPMLPAINSEMNMSYGQMGYILSSQFLGCFIAVVLGGCIAEKSGNKPLILAGGCLIVSGLAGSVLSHNYIQLLCCNIVTGLGFGCYEIAINALCADENETNKGSAMNFLHFFFGLGAISGPVLATICTGAFGSWRLTFGITMLLPVLVTAILIPIRVKKIPAIKDRRKSIAFRDSFLWIAGLCTFLYVGIETSVFGWIPVFWEQLPSNNLIPASLIGTIFWGALTAGRFISGLITDRLGFPRFLLLAAAGASVFSLLWFIVPSSIVTFICILFIGLFLAGIFPTILASLTSYHPASSAKIASFATIFGSMGGLLVPTGIGKISDRTGIASYPAIILLITLMMTAGIYTAWFRMKKA